MKRLLLFAVLACSLVLNACAHPKPKPPNPPPPPAQNVFCVAPIVRDAVTKRPVAGANEFVDKLNGQSNVDGYHYFFPVPMPNVLNIFADGYLDYSEKIDIQSLSCNHDVFLTPKRGPRPTLAQTMNIKANFASMRDGQNRLMFSWFYPLLATQDQALWEDTWRAQGVTHVVLDWNICYPNYWVPCGDLRSQPATLVAAMSRLLDRGFIPIVMMTTGDTGTNAEVDQFWPSFVATMHQMEPCLIGEAGDPCAILIPCFECVGPGGAWRSAMFAHALQWAQTSTPSAVWFAEFAPERATGSSHPLEADDPWQGNESGFWTSHGGEFLKGLAYEFPHGPKLLEDQGASGSFCHVGSPCFGFEDRWFEILQRPCSGGAGWRQVACSAFEVTSSDYKGGGVPENLVLQINDRILRLCQAVGVTCSFGSGLPDGPR